MRKPMTMLLFLPAFALQAQEICGLQLAKFEQPDPIFRSGFENVAATVTDAVEPASPSQVKAVRAKGATLGPALSTVAIPILGVAPTITFTSPANNASLSMSGVQLEGTFTGTANTGISFRGVPVFTIGNRFVTSPLQFDSGSQTVSVTAKTMDGLTATAARTLTFTAPLASDFMVSAQPGASFTPYKARFSVRPTGIQVSNIAINFDGDGTDDYIGSVANIPIRTYALPGIYRARFVITAVGGQTFTRFLSVAALSLPETRSRVCSVYAHLRARLRANDNVGVKQTMTQQFYFQFEPVLVALGTNRGTFADRLGTIANGIFAPTNAEIALVNVVGSTVEGAPIRMTQSADGIWRIDSL
jgi:hypothetical protein